MRWNGDSVQCLTNRRTYLSAYKAEHGCRWTAQRPRNQGALVWDHMQSTTIAQYGEQVQHLCWAACAAAEAAAGQQGRSTSRSSAPHGSGDPCAVQRESVPKELRCYSVHEAQVSTLDKFYALRYSSIAWFSMRQHPGNAKC